MPARAVVGASAARDPDGVRRHTVAIMLARGLCSGVLIARDVVATAAHCLAGNTPRSIVALDPSFRPRFLRIARAISHPSFRHARTPMESAGIDIALIKLAQAAPDDMVPARIGSFATRGDVFLAGFGVSQTRGDKAGTLRGAMMRARTVDWKAHRLIAAIGADGGQAKTGTGGCRGDSGGPFYDPDTGALLGLVSWSSGLPGQKGTCGGLTIATEIGDHRAWIDATLADLAGPPAPSPAPERRRITPPSLPDPARGN